MIDTPPRLATWLIARRLPSHHLEYLAGDLEERYREIRASHGPAAATRWYWKETLALTLRRWPERPAATGAATGDSWLTTLGRDVHQSLRVLRRAPLFSGLVVLTFAIGLGAAAAIFSVLDPVLLRGAPYPAADRLLMLWGREKDGSPRVGYLTFRDVEKSTTTLKDIAVMSYWTPILRGVDESERLMGQRVSNRFFATLGVRPELGRDFRPEEDHSSSRNVVILSYRLWQSHFRGDSGIVGQSITLGDQSLTVIGVMPRHFESLLAPEAQLWAPLGYEDTDPWACRGCQHLRMIGRLADGSSRAAATSDLNSISARMVRENPTEYSAVGFVLTPLNDHLTRAVRPVLLATAGAVAVLLLIACVNVMNLFLTRSARRTAEFAVRTALGAGAWPLVRQALTEAVVLALLGGGVALLLAYGVVKGIVRMAPANLPRLDQVTVNQDVFLFTFAVAALAGICGGLVPATAAMHANIGSLLKNTGRSIARAGRRIRTVLVVAEVALALVLLSGAGLLVRSLGQLLAVDPGFEAKGLVTLELNPFGSRYDSVSTVEAFYRRVIDGVSALPGVTGAAATTQLVLSGDYDTWGVHLESKPSINPADDPESFRFGVTPGYLATMRIPLLRGRDLNAADDADAPLALLINHVMARKLFADMDPLGQRIKIGGTDGPWRTVIGITGDVRHQSLDAEGEMEMYVPTTQSQWAETRRVLVVRGDADPSQLVPSIRRVIREIDASVPVSTVATMTEHIQTRAATRRFARAVFQVFAGVALLLAGLGLYGVLSGSVTERTREIGIRSALGASSGRLLAMVVRHALMLTLIGMSVGLVSALFLTGLLRSLLYGVTPTDPTTFALVALLLLVVALAAASIPAWRAARVDPASVLREE
jgi:putative ABC transport system permease protein